MNTLRHACHSVIDFCHRVIQWRSSCTVPYIFAVNTTFWAIAYYGTVETQMRSLAALAFIIFCNDVLLSATHDRSVIVQILTWPIRDFWKTAAVVLCGLGIHQLREGNNEEALWCSFLAVAFILISPVYKYNEINQKILDTWFAAGSFIKNILIYCVIRPILFVYEGLKYVFLLKWLPGLKEWLRSSRSAVYAGLDRAIVQRIRAFNSRDLKSLLYVHLGEPLLLKLRVVRDRFVYVFGGYWFYPLMKQCGRWTWSLSCYFASIGNQFAIMVGNSVLWPTAVFAYEKLNEVSTVLYDAFGRPVVNALHQKYKAGEDVVFVYVIGPSVKALLDSIPEKNPFYNEEDHELDEFLPGPVGDANIIEEGTPDDKTHDSSEPLLDDGLDDLDDVRFLAKRLQRGISGSDSSLDSLKFY